MKLIIGSRQTGKTTDAVAWVRHGEWTQKGWSRVLLVPHHEMLRWVVEAFDLDPDQVCTIETWRSRKRGRYPSDVEVFVDEARLALSALLGSNVGGISISFDEVCD